MIFVLPQSLNLQLQLSVFINVFKMEAKLLRFQLHVKKLFNSRVIVYIDSKTAFSTLQSKRLQGFLNHLLREMMLKVAVNNILVEPRWLEFKGNSLADPFSRFNK